VLTPEQAEKLAETVSHICNSIHGDKAWDYGFKGHESPPAWVVTRTVKRRIKEALFNMAYPKEGTKS
jgi:hypothetical protein